MFGNAVSLTSVPGILGVAVLLLTVWFTGASVVRLLPKPRLARRR